MRVVRTISLTCLPALLIGCAGASSGLPPAAPVAAPGPTVTASSEALPPLRWPVRTLEHVDLWLHAFALLSEDSSAVPLYRRGYRDSLVVVKNRRNVLTALDGNREALSKGLRRAGYLNAQFLPFAFTSWEELRTTAERFLQFEGDPRRAPDRDTALRMATLASVFPAASDREWLRLFVASVEDEQVRFFNAEHNALLRSRAAVITAIDSLWQQVYRAKFERFLNNTGQRQGDVLLSLPIGGEGRTSPGVTGRTMVAVTYPARVADAPEVLYVLAHEITGTLVGPAVADNVTPAEQRSGEADRHVAIGQVQAGAMLLTRIAPELVPGYMRYYLIQVGTRSADLTDPTLTATFASRFPLPTAIREALTRQIDIVLSGIWRAPIMSDLPRTALERVLARAADLQTTSSSDPNEVISEERLVEIAREVGLDVGHVRQAIAEERAQLSLQTPAGGALLDSLGPAILGAQRTVPGTPEEILRRLEAWLPRNEFLTPVRRSGDRMVWEPRRDPVGNVLRSLGGGGRRFDLVRLDQLVISATRVDDGRTVLRLDAVVDGARRQVRSATAIAGSMFLLLLLLTAIPMFALALVVPQVAVVTTALLGALAIGGTYLTWYGLKQGFRTLVGRVQTRLEFLLDEEQHGRLTQTPSLLDKLLK